MPSCSPLSVFSWLWDLIPFGAQTQPVQQPAQHFALIGVRLIESRNGCIYKYHRHVQRWHHSLPASLPSYHGHSHEYVHDQAQSNFFRKLPTEIRESIYQLVLGDPYRVVHLTVMIQRICHIRCRVEQDSYPLKLQHPCWGKHDRSDVHCGRGNDDPPDANLLALLKSCHRVYVLLSVKEAVIQAD